MLLQARFRLVAITVCLTSTLIPLWGCGGRDDLGTVSGRITLDGEPLPNAFVQFVPQESEGGTGNGRTDASGEYSLMYSRTVKGAALGKNIVRITTHDILDEGGKQINVPEKVPTKYNSRSELTATVEPGRNTFNFDLNSDKGRVVQPEVTY